MKKYKSYLERITLVKELSDYPRSKITCSRQSFEVLSPLFHDSLEVYESFYMLTLNRGNITTGYSMISQGGITATVVDIRIIAKIALENLATGVIIAHNHPSGRTQPSEEDIKITKKIKDALKLLDIDLLDHIILCSIFPVSSYYSFADDGLL